MGWDSSLANGLKDKAYAKPGVIFFLHGSFPHPLRTPDWSNPGLQK